MLGQNPGFTFLCVTFLPLTFSLNSWCELCCFGAYCCIFGTALEGPLNPGQNWTVTCGLCVLRKDFIKFLNLNLLSIRDNVTQLSNAALQLDETMRLSQALCLVICSAVSG